ncbi:MAG: MlaD family protein [Pseudomonadota bacterium]
MTTRAQKIRLGLFLLLAFLLLAGTVLTLAGIKIWNTKDRYQVHFTHSVSGLESGSTVRMKGVRVGQVENITIDKKNVEEVVVTLALEPGTPVKTDARAVMTSIGITGLNFIELTGGSSQAGQIPPNTKNSIILPADSVMQSLTGKATEISKKMEQVLNNLLPLTGESNRTKVASLLDNANRLAGAWADLAVDNGHRIKRILANTDRATSAVEKAMTVLGKMTTDNAARIASTLASAEDAARGLNKIIQTIKPQAALAELTRSAKAFRSRVEDPSITKAIESLNDTATRIAKLSSNLNDLVRRRDRQLDSVMINLNQAANNLKSFSREIKERPSLLLRGETRKERDIP